MGDKKITEEQIEKIIESINEHRTMEVKKILKNLSDCKEEELEKFKEKIERLVRDKGRTSHIPISEIKQVIMDYESLVRRVISDL